MRSVHQLADDLCRDLGVSVIELWPRDIHECALCGEVKRCDHCVAFYCEPTHDEIGSVSTQYTSTDGKPAIVGGMTCCKECHDAHEASKLRLDRNRKAR